MWRGKLWSGQHWGLYFRWERFAVTALWNFCGNTSFLFPISIRCPQSTSDKADWGGDVITFETWAMCVFATASVCDCIQYVCVLVCLRMCVVNGNSMPVSVPMNICVLVGVWGKTCTSAFSFSLLLLHYFSWRNAVLYKSCRYNSYFYHLQNFNMTLLLHQHTFDIWSSSTFS